MISNINTLQSSTLLPVSPKLQIHHTWTCHQVYFLPVRRTAVYCPLLILTILHFLDSEAKGMGNIHIVYTRIEQNSLKSPWQHTFKHSDAEDH